jgi:hypothetical protein
VSATHSYQRPSSTKLFTLRSAAFLNQHAAVLLTTFGRCSGAPHVIIAHDSPACAYEGVGYFLTIECCQLKPFHLAQQLLHIVTLLSSAHTARAYREALISSGFMLPSIIAASAAAP